MLYSGADPESYITEYTLVYEDQGDSHCGWRPRQDGVIPHPQPYTLQSYTLNPTPSTLQDGVIPCTQRCTRLWCEGLWALQKVVFRGSYLRLIFCITQL